MFDQKSQHNELLVKSADDIDAQLELCKTLRFSIKDQLFSNFIKAKRTNTTIEFDNLELDFQFVKRYIRDGRWDVFGKAIDVYTGKLKDIISCYSYIDDFIVLPHNSYNDKDLYQYGFKFIAIVGRHKIIDSAIVNITKNGESVS